MDKKAKGGSINLTIKAGFWYTVTNFMLKGFAFVMVPILMRIGGDEAFGTYQMFTSQQSIFLVIVTGSLFTSINRAQFDFKHELDSYISSITVLGSLLTLGCYLTAWLFQGAFVSFTGLEMRYIHILFLYLLIEPAIQNLQTVDRLRLRYKPFIAISVLISISTLTLAVTMANLLEDKAYGMVVGRVLPIIVIGGILYLVILWRGKTLYKPEHWSYALRIAIPLIPHTLSGTLLSNSDNWMIGKLRGEKEVTSYSVVYNIASVVTLISSSINQAWSPWLFQRLNEEDYDTVKRVSKPYFLLLLIPSIGLLLLGPEVVYIYNKNQMGAIYALPPIMCGLVCQFFYTFYVNVEIFHKKTFWISLATMSAAGLNIALNFVFVPIFGYVAASFTTFAGYLCLLWVHYRNVKKLGLNTIYDNRWHLLLTLLFFALAASCYILYQFTILRYCVILAFGVGVIYYLYKNKTAILAVLKNRGAES